MAVAGFLLDELLLSDWRQLGGEGGGGRVIQGSGMTCRARRAFPRGQALSDSPHSGSHVRNGASKRAPLLSHSSGLLGSMSSTDDRAQTADWARVTNNEAVHPSEAKEGGGRDTLIDVAATADPATAK